MPQTCIDRPAPLHSNEHRPQERYDGTLPLVGVSTSWQLCCESQLVTATVDDEPRLPAAINQQCGADWRLNVAQACVGHPVSA